MAALPYIQLYVADYLADTMHLTTEEHGAYLLIIMNYWQTGKPIPKKRLQAIARMSNDRWNSVEDSLSEFFTETDDGLWIHSRIEGDLAKVASKSTQASEAGKRSAAKRAKSKATDNKGDSNGRSNSVERESNYTDTDTDTDKDITTLLNPQAEEVEAEAKPESKPTDLKNSETENLAMDWVAYFVNQKAFQIHEAHTAKTVPMFRDWVRDGVTIDDVELAIVGCNAWLKGKKATSPTTYNKFVIDVLELKQKSHLDRAGAKDGLSQNNGVNYVTKANNNETGVNAGRKPSLAEQADQGLERVRQRKQREQNEQLALVN